MTQATEKMIPAKFGARDAFQTALRERVAAYFTTTGRRPRDCPRMYAKTASVFGWALLSYVLLVFVVQTWWLAIPLALSLGLAVAALGFNVQHDAGHQAYSERPWINRLLASTQDLLGGSSYLWARKHNQIHHTYTNVTGQDDDIDIGFLGRLTPQQPRWKLHRLQHYYLWFLYCLLPLKWQLFDDFRDILTGKIAGHRFARPRGWELVTFVGGKVVFFSLALLVPLLFHSVWAVLLTYLLVSVTQGLVLSVVFQMAHCVEEAEFPQPRPDTGLMPAPWAAHQVLTTVNFARRNWLLSWFIGGLNYQIEHHLFPQICHIHYPKISAIVEETCNDFGLRYRSHRTFLAGIASHFRWLRRMGMPLTVPVS